MDRMNTFIRKTMPIMDYYEKETDTKVIHFEAKKGVDDYPAIKEIIHRELKI